MERRGRMSGSDSEVTGEQAESLKATESSCWLFFTADGIQHPGKIGDEGLGQDG